MAKRYNKSWNFTYFVWKLYVLGSLDKIQPTFALNFIFQNIFILSKLHD